MDGSGIRRESWRRRASLGGGARAGGSRWSRCAGRRPRRRGSPPKSPRTEARARGADSYPRALFEAGGDDELAVERRAERPDRPNAESLLGEPLRDLLGAPRAAAVEENVH